MAFIALAAYYLYPSFQFYGLSSEEKAAMEKSEPARLADLLDRSFNLGLDLQGGIHLVMEVELENLPEEEAQDAVDRAQEVIRTYLGLSALRIGDLPLVIETLEPLRRETGDVSNLVVLGNAYMDNHEEEKGLAVLREARGRFPDEPTPLYWLARHQYQRNIVDREYVERAVEVLRRDSSGKGGVLSRMLAEMLENRAGDFLGRISYSLYLLHMPLLQLLPDDASEYPTLALLPYLGLVLLVSWLSYRLIEYPARKGLRRGLGSA